MSAADVHKKRGAEPDWGDTSRAFVWSSTQTSQANAKALFAIVDDRRGKISVGKAAFSDAMQAVSQKQVSVADAAAQYCVRGKTLGLMLRQRSKVRADVMHKRVMARSAVELLSSSVAAQDSLLLRLSQRPRDVPMAQRPALEALHPSASPPTASSLMR